MEALSLQTWSESFSSEEILPQGVQEYLDFITEATTRYDPQEYFEWHHIIPKCVDESSQFINQLVPLRAKDHVLAHKLLLNCFCPCDKRRKLGYALHMMLSDPTGQRVKDLTPEEYEELRILWAQSVVGIRRSQETCQKISQTLGDGRLAGENHPRYGEHCSDETKEKISSALKKIWTDEKRENFSERRTGPGNPCYGKKLPPRKMTEDSRKKMSDSGKNKIWINDGKTSTKIRAGEPIPEGWVKGRLYVPREEFVTNSRGKIWINNGEVSRKIPKDSEIPEGFVRGKVQKKK